MKNTQKKILRAACLLFNKHSYSMVTIRMIAGHLGMSSGNLNYHFKKREDILEALYFEMVAVFDQRVEGLADFKISMENIREEMKTSMLRMLDYRFFWTDIYNIMRDHKHIRDHFQVAYQKRLAGYLFLFDQLSTQGFLTKPTYEKAFHFLAEQMIRYSNTWLYASALETRQVTAENIDHWVDTLYGMLLPYLNAKGRRAFRDATPSFLADYSNEKNDKLP